MSERMTAAEYQAALAKPMSVSERNHRLFASHIRARRLPEPRWKYGPGGELVFMEGEIIERHTKRKKLKNGRRNSPSWSFDFAWPEQRIAVEVEGVSVHRVGGQFVVGGRHGSIEGFKEDCEKYAWAAVMGWRLMRFEQSQVRAGLAIDMLVRLFASLAANTADVRNADGHLSTCPIYAGPAMRRPCECGAQRLTGHADELAFFPGAAEVQR